MALFLIILNNNKKSGFGAPIYKKFLWIKTYLYSPGWYSSQSCHLNCQFTSSKALPPEKIMCLLWVNAKLLQSYCRPPGSSVYGFSKQEYWSGIAMPSSRGSFWLRDQTCMSYVSCIGRWVLYHSRHLESPVLSVVLPKFCPNELLNFSCNFLTWFAEGLTYSS